MSATDEPVVEDQPKVLFTYKLETVPEQTVYAVVTVDNESTGIFTTEKDRAKLVARLLEEHGEGAHWVVKTTKNKDNI